MSDSELLAGYVHAWWASVQDFLALLRLVENPADEMSWFRVLQLLEGVGPARARKVVNRLVTPVAAPSEPEDGALWAPEVRPADPLADLPSSARDLAREVLSALEFARASTAPGEIAHILRDALAPLVLVLFVVMYILMTTGLVRFGYRGR